MRINIKIIAALLAILCVFSICSCKNNGKDNNNSDSIAAKNDSSANVDKHITIIVVNNKNEEKKFNIETKRKMLGEALTDEGLIKGEKGQYGLYVKTVDGLTVDDANEEWWCLTKSGETVVTGVDSTPIADGDCFEFTFSVGY